MDIVRNELEAKIATAEGEQKAEYIKQLAEYNEFVLLLNA